MKRITQILCIGITITYLFAVGEAGAIFLLISPGAGPQGAGEAQVAKADDVYASYQSIPSHNVNRYLLNWAFNKLQKNF